MPELQSERTVARMKTVEQHFRAENLHDLDAIMETFGDAPRYDDRAFGEHFVGPIEVRSYYEELIGALPDLYLDIEEIHVTSESIVVELVATGTHTGSWRGLPGTGRRVQFPVCAVHTFDEQNKIAGERLYYDRATLFRQVGLYHEPFSGSGRVITVLVHPVTIVRAFWRNVLGR